MFLKKIIHFFIFFSCISVASATDFVKIEGTGHEVEPGEMVALRAIVDNSNIPTGFDINKAKFIWSISPNKNFIVWPDGQQIFFAAGIKQGKYIVNLNVTGFVEVRKPFTVFDDSNNEIKNAVVVVEGAAEPITSVITEINPVSSTAPVYDISVGGQPPEPDPNPGPKPPPTPNFPPGKYNLSNITYMIVTGNVPASGRLQALDLAKSFTNIAGTIQQSLTKQAAGVALTNEDIKLDTESILKAVRESNSKVFLATGIAATDKQAWLKWNELYGDVIYDLYKSGKISTPQDWITAFQETAQGLLVFKTQVIPQIRIRNIYAR